MARRKQIDRAIENLQSEIGVLTAAIARLRAEAERTRLPQPKPPGRKASQKRAIRLPIAIDEADHAD